MLSIHLILLELIITKQTGRLCYYYHSFRLLSCRFHSTELWFYDIELPGIKSLSVFSTILRCSYAARTNL